MRLWGIDLGGTKTELAVIDILPRPETSYTQVYRKRIPTDRTRGAAGILKGIAMLVDVASAELGEKPSALGVGHPGSIDPDTLKLRNSNTTELNGTKLAVDLEQLLQIRLTCENDANCFALAEAELGSARGAPTVFGVILGTGVGGGLVVNSRVLTGLQGLAGEWGHNQFDPDGATCYCSQRGCLETLISGPRLEEYYRSLRAGSLDDTSSPSLMGIYQASKTTSDPYWDQTLNHLLKHFSRALAHVINIFDPHCIVLGGGVSNIDELYWPECRKLVAERVFHDSPRINLVRNKLGDSAGVFGAALCSASDRS